MAKAKSESVATSPSSKKDVLEGIGQFVSSVKPKADRWFWDRFLTANELHYIVGQPGAGKSTLGGYLISMAKKPALITSVEESEGALVNRLKAVGADRKALWLNQRHWLFPDHATKLAEIVTHHGIDFLWIDPIDSFIEGSENDTAIVRPALESLARIADKCGVTIVCVRHPGKNPNNPLPGSRAWRAVPRRIIELRVDLGPPERKTMSAFKPHGAFPTYLYTTPPLKKSWQFVLGEVTGLSETETDEIERLKIREAEHLIRALLEEEEQLSSWVYSQADKEKISERTMRKAAKNVGVLTRREGTGASHKSYWFLPDSGTPAL